MYDRNTANVEKQLAYRQWNQTVVTKFDECAKILRDMSGELFLTRIWGETSTGVMSYQLKHNGHITAAVVLVDVDIAEGRDLMSPMWFTDIAEIEEYIYARAASSMEEKDTLATRSNEV